MVSPWAKAMDTAENGTAPGTEPPPDSTPPKQNLGGSWRAPGVARVHASPRSTGGLEEEKKKKSVKRRVDLFIAKERQVRGE